MSPIILPTLSTLDFLPTFAHLAGIDAENYATDGKNLFISLKNQEGHQSLYFDMGFQWSVREGDWKLRHINNQEGKKCRSSYWIMNMRISASLVYP